VAVGPRGDDDARADQPGTFTSRLELGPGAWRQFVTEHLVLAVGVGSTVGVWVAWWGVRGTSTLALAVVWSCWCAYASRGWLLRLRRRRGVLDSGMPTLALDDLGARVRHPYGNPDGAYVAWADCAAVVVSRMPTAGRTPDAHRAYVELVPVAPDRVEGVARARDQRTELFDRTPDQVRLIWVEYVGVGREAGEVTAWLRARRPGLKVVDSLAAHSASTL
jgi:hypothetical protein